MVSDDKSRNELFFQKTAQTRGHKQKIQHKSELMESSQISEAGKQFRSVVADTPENLRICMEHCGTCPSLPFPPEPFLFCARGCSSEMVLKKSCNCPVCPIYNKYRLQSLYFCETGKAAERRNEERKA